MANWLLVQTFYIGLKQSLKISVDTTVGGALTGKSIDIAKVLVEEMTSNNYHWYSERVIPKRRSGRYKVKEVTLLASNVDALTQRLDRVGSSPTPGNSLGPVRVYTIYEIYGIQGHTSAGHYNDPFII